MLWELVRKDLKLFLADRRGMIVTIGVPIALAAFMAYVFGGAGKGDGAGMNALPIAVVDRDETELTRKIVEDMKKSGLVEPRVMSGEEASGSVTTGKYGAAVFIPPGFSKRATTSLFSGEKPEVRVIYDPSKGIELQVVRGALMQSGIQTVTREAFSSANWRTTAEANLQRIESSGKMPASQKLALRALFMSLDRFFQDTTPTTGPTSTQPADASPLGAPGLGTPFTLIEEPIGGTTGKNVINIRRATVSHIFAGMTIQGVLFFAIEAAMNLLRDRGRGIWKRFRAAPLSRATLLAARTASGTLISLVIVAAVMLFGAILYGIRVDGSIAGFVLIVLATSLMASTFGLLIATVGKTEQQSRGFAILGVLIMVMLSGAWFPSFMMPKIVQDFSLVLPSRWAIDGLDSMLWRRLGFVDAIRPALALLGFAGLFAGVALARFRWEEA